MSDQVEPPVMAALARKVIDLHEEWDSLHQLLVIARDGKGGIDIPVIGAIDPAFDPALYPVLIARLASESGQRPYALLLQVEAFGVHEDPGAAQAGKDALDADRRSRSIHLRPDAEEQAMAILADVHGRTWSVVKTRSTGQVAEAFYPPGAGDVIGGRFATALRDVLRLYGEQG